MKDSNLSKGVDSVDRAIALVEAALNQCDEQGFIYVAIDISSALDKLKALKIEKSGE